MGAADRLQPERCLCSQLREHGAQLWRGVTLKELFLYWGGDERGNDFAGPREDFRIVCRLVRTLPHAVGVEPWLFVCVEKSAPPGAYSATVRRRKATSPKP